jgi:TonB family protein
VLQLDHEAGADAVTLLTQDGQFKKSLADMPGAPGKLSKPAELSGHEGVVGNARNHQQLLEEIQKLNRAAKHDPEGGERSGGPGTVPDQPARRIEDVDFSQIQIAHQPPSPPYPPLAKIAKIQGVVVVEVTMNGEGVPTKTTAVDGPPQLRPAAEAYAMEWRFKPVLRNGAPQVVRFKMALAYKLKQGGTGG